MNRTLTFTLAYNLYDEVAQSIERLYDQNKGFQHLIVDCSFPLIKDEIPDDIEAAKQENTQKLIALSDKYDCDFLKIENEGVSQNWNKVIEYLHPDVADILIAVDPDEIAIENDWVKALTDVLRADKNSGYAAPLLMDAKEILDKNVAIKEVGGHAVYDMGYANMNYGFLAIHGRFLSKIRQIPVPSNMQVYGSIERTLLEKLKIFNMSWVILKNFTEVHTDNCKVYRAWKNHCIYEQAYKGMPQTGFEEYIKTIKNGASINL